MRRFPVAAAILSVLFAVPAWAQTAIQPGTIVGTFEVQGYLQAYGVIYTVPAGKTARITDLHATNFGATNCMFTVTLGGITRWAYVAPNASFVMPLNTGFGLTAGQTVYGTGCATDLFLQARGFYFTIP